MADQYQGFTNPTIIPDKPVGWQAANQQTADAIAGITKYAMSQAQKIQDLQLQQATDLSKFKTLDQVYYGGAHGQQLDDLLSQNPYGKHLVSKQPQGPLSAAGQSPMGNPNAGAAMIGATGGSPFGLGNLPMPGTGAAPGMPAPAGGTSMSPMNPTNAPIVTGGSTTQKAFEPPSFTQSYTNPAAQAQIKGAETGASAMASAQAEANIGVAKDAQQLGMITNALKPLMESYDKVYNSKVVGILPAAGDVYGSGVVKNLDWVPRGAQSSVVNPDTQAAAGQFLANKNEIVTKLQPLLSQQFGKDGSTRIMDSLLKMSQNEIGDLNTPKAQLHGQVAGTISSLYRIAKAAQGYKQDLDNSGQSAPDPDTAAKEIMNRMSLQQQTPQEQQELQGLINDTLGIKSTGGATGSFSGSMNPVAQAKPKQQAQNNPASKFSRQEILDEINRRKNLQDIQSNISK